MPAETPDETLAAAGKPAAKKPGKQAVVVIHGMGEQIPMQTLQGFVQAVWATDRSLLPAGRPDSKTGGPRTENPVWSKPDARYHSHELRRLTTEALENGVSTDFYEFYWAHLMHGTTWEHFKSWFVDLLWRAPRRVPGAVFSAWIVLWLVAAIVALVAIASVLPLDDLRQCLNGACAAPPVCTPGALCWTWVWPIIIAAGMLLLGWFVNSILLSKFGDVARYVKAAPPNVARRQEIREKGVALLAELMAPGPNGRQEYRRIIVVAHSLGTIVAYDILTHCFVRMNRQHAATLAKDAAQPERIRLEAMIRAAAGADGPAALDLDAFQAQQQRSLQELNAEGNPWIVSDFITLGSPLTHAEFLLAEDRADLRRARDRRVLPTCPPVPEFDMLTRAQHVTYRIDHTPLKPGEDPMARPRVPHHAALFAYTRWTNLYAPHRAILWGDIISGPVGPQFDLVVNDREISGIRDIPVFPAHDANGAPVGKPPFFCHGEYWALPGAGAVPYHISVLRQALALNEG